MQCLVVGGLVALVVHARRLAKGHRLRAAVTLLAVLDLMLIVFLGFVTFGIAIFLRAGT